VTIESLWDEIPPPEKLFYEVVCFLKEKNIPLDLECDHICYRIESLARYNHLKEIFQKHGFLRNESLVNGRNICIFQMPSPISYYGLSTECVELPEPKLNSPYKEGWEHAEIVTRKPLIDFIKTFPDLTFETQSLHKKINPEITIKISEATKIKFHEQSILDVISLENSAKAH
jgi:hypothetical protein